MHVLEMITHQNYKKKKERFKERKMKVKIEIESKEFNDKVVFNSIEEASNYLENVSNNLWMDEEFERRKKEEEAFAEATFMELDQRNNLIGNNLINRAFDLLPPQIKSEVYSAPRCSIHPDNIIVSELAYNSRIEIGEILITKLKFDRGIVYDGLNLEVEELSEKEKIKILSTQLKNKKISPLQVALSI